MVRNCFVTRWCRCSPARDSPSLTGTKSWRYLRHLAYVIFLRSGTFKMLSTGDDRQSGAEKARSPQAGSSQTTTKMALAGAFDQRARSANGLPKASGRHQMGRAISRVGRCHGSAVAGPGLSKYLCTDRRRGTTRRSPTCPRRAVISLRLGTDSLWGEQEFSCKTRPKRSAPKEHETNGGR